MTREQILEERCKRLRTVIRYFGLNTETLNYLQEQCELTPNDVRFLLGEKEIESDASCEDIYRMVHTAAQPKEQASIEQSDGLFLWNILKNFNDYFNTLRDAGQKPDMEMLALYCSIVQIWDTKGMKTA